MKLSLFKTAIMFVLILTTTAYCQQQGLGFSYYGGGARSEGMGQAYIALSDDGAAGGWNPAGLYIHESTLMGFNYSSLNPSGYNKYFASHQRAIKTDHTGRVGSINDWNIISPLRISNHHVVLNISYVRNFDTHFEFYEKLYEWSDFDPDDPLDDDDPNAFMQRKGGINSFNLAMGTRINKEFSAGFSANIYTGKVVTNESRMAVVDTNAYQGGHATGIINFETIDSSSYSGFNFTLGLMYTRDNFRAGLMLRTPFVMTASSDSTLYILPSINGLPADQGGGMFDADTVYINNMTSKIEMPMMLGFGMAYNIKDNWLVSSDVEYRGFKGKKVENLDSLFLTATGDVDEFYSATDATPNWSNVLQFRFGTEYLFDTKFGEIPLRFGARTEVFPSGNINDYTTTYESENSAGGTQQSDGSSLEVDSRRVSYAFTYDTDKITGWSVSAGTGIHWSQILLDCAITYTTYRQNVYQGVDAENNKILRSKNRWQNYHFNIGFVGYF
ncbi:MAG: hypothetical protein GY865_04345 [candidate division Zixibacteria bacterium]|nr:hypothetical protein [candidate division Zixibacteria bacterium]